MASLATADSAWVCLILEQLTNVLAAVGASLMALRRRSSVMSGRLGCSGSPRVVMLAVMRLSATLADLQPGTGVLQALAVLAITPALAPAGPEAGGTAPDGLLAVAAVGSLAVLVFTSGPAGLAGRGNGCRTAAFSTWPAAARISTFYMTTPELASARWLGQPARQDSWLCRPVCASFR